MEQDPNILNDILDKWISELPQKDRSKNAVENNFDELWQAFKKAGADYKVAKTYLDKAIKAHLPSPIVKKNVWKNLKGKVDATEQEFYDSWLNGIKNTATNIFFEVFPIPVKKTDDDDDGLPKKFGSMSEKEYKLQRKHADSFPTLNTDKLEEEMRNRRKISSMQNILGGNDDN